MLSDMPSLVISNVGKSITFTPLLHFRMADFRSLHPSPYCCLSSYSSSNFRRNGHLVG